MTPTLAKKKDVFLESYTDSPEFPYIDNPVVYMEEELLPEEQGLSPIQLQPMPSPRGSVRARHPLSQVSFPESSPSPQDTRHVMPAQGSIIENSASDTKYLIPAVTRPTALKEADKVVIVIDDDEDEEDCEDDEEPEDDTFEFLLR